MHLPLLARLCRIVEKRLVSLDVFLAPWINPKTQLHTKIGTRKLLPLSVSITTKAVDFVVTFSCCFLTIRVLDNAITRLFKLAHELHKTLKADVLIDWRRAKIIVTFLISKRRRENVTANLKLRALIKCFQFYLSIYFKHEEYVTSDAVVEDTVFFNICHHFPNILNSFSGHNRLFIQFLINIEFVPIAMYTFKYKREHSN